MDVDYKSALQRLSRSTVSFIVDLRELKDQENIKNDETN